MSAVKSEPVCPMTLRATVAEELMTANPRSIEETRTLKEALVFFVDKAISGAPVINDAGWPVGVLSRTDLLVHDREEPTSSPSPYRPADTLVRDVMTEGVFAVGRHTPAERVIEKMCGLNVHRLFVVDASGVLVGVITPMDVLRQLTSNAP